MPFRTNNTGAGKDIDAFNEGTRRFQERHPNLDWEIVAGQYQGQLHLTVIISGGHAQPVPVTPTLDMADSIVKALEQILASKK